MKFEDFLMQRNEEKQKKMELQEEVVKLQADLDREHRLACVLQCALHKPIVSHSHLSSRLPLEVQMLLAEVTIVEQEIICLERKLEDLKISLYQENKQTKEWQSFRQRQLHHKHHTCRSRNRRKPRNHESHSGKSFNSADFRSRRWSRERIGSLGSASEVSTMSSKQLNDEFFETTCIDQNRKMRLMGDETCTGDPNKLSEDLLNCLIGIFLKLNVCKVSATVPKLSLSCIKPRSIVGKTSFNCKAPTVISDNEQTCVDPYGILPDIDGTVRDVGPYKNFVQFTRSSLDMSRLPECFPAIRKLRNLMNILSTTDLNFLTYRQKIAFWINIYNACIMHAYLQHGLPTTIEKQLALMNKAALNVGGIVLNALAIEHFILRHPYDSKNVSRQGTMDGKAKLLWHAYGLGYPEPNVTFALCRGSWSSPALRVYTADGVVNELGKAKSEYLQASVGVTSKKKILVPKLLQWHMQDFADNMESLLEWIYSQLPRSGSVNRLIMECLTGETRTPITRMVETQPYESEFRYLLQQ